MFKSQIDSAALAATALAATLALTLLAGPFSWMGSIIGLVLLVVLFSFDQEGYRTVAGSLAFSAVCGFCFAVGCGAVLASMAAHGEVHLADGGWQTVGLPFAFLFATLVLWAVDRSRMSARAPATERVQSHPGGIQGSFIRPTAPMISNFEPQQSYVQQASSQPRYSQPSYPQADYPQPTYSPQVPVTTQPAVASPAAFAQPTATVPPPTPAVSAPPPVVQTESYAPPPTIVQTPPLASAEPSPTIVRGQPQTSTPLASESPRPAAAPAIVPRGGKEVMIYVSLLGEGLNVMRTVRAEHLGRDYYQIIDTMPAEETWQFQPGQVVRCKKQNLSTGKALVAVEEARRSQ